MNGAIETGSTSQIRPLRGEALLRGLHRILPLGRKYHPLLSAMNGRAGWMAVPFGGFHVVQPACWAKQITHQLLNGVDVVPEFGLVSSLVRPLTSGCIIDVGANLGLYTLLLRSVSARPIISFEPQPFLFKLLETNIAFNRLPCVEARNVACGAQSGRVPFTLGINGSISDGAAAEGAALSDDPDTEARRTQQGNTVVNVPLVGLDENLARVTPIALLKIDCEGFEFDILQGARNLIERQRPVLFLEVHPTLLGRFGHSVEEILNFLNPHYDLEFWCFDRAPRRSKLGKSLAKFRKPAGQRYAGSADMLAAAQGERRPAQIYFIGHPRKRPGLI